MNHVYEWTKFIFVSRIVILCRAFSAKLSYLRVWVSNHNNANVSDVITHPSPSFHGGLAIAIEAWMGNYTQRIISYGVITVKSLI